MVLLDRRTRRLFAYNDSAAISWRALKCAGRPADAINAITRAYGITREVAARDFAAIAEHWQSLGFFDRRVLPRKRVSQSADPVAADIDGVPNYLHGAYRLRGMVFRISVEDRYVAQRVTTTLRPYRAQESEASHRVEVRKGTDGNLVLRCDGVATVRVRSVAEMTGALFQTLLSQVHSYADWLAIIHGGAAAVQDRAVLFPGASGSGKSTLGAFLVSRGFDYLSDDMIAVTGEGSIAAWPTPISIKRGSWKSLAPHFPELEAVVPERVWDRTVKYLPVPSASWDAPQCPARLLVFPKFDSAVRKSRLTPLRSMEALRRLISDRIWLGYPLRAHRIERFLSWLAQVRYYELSYSDFDGVEGLVREVLERNQG